MSVYHAFFEETRASGTDCGAVMGTPVIVHRLMSSSSGGNTIPGCILTANGNVKLDPNFRYVIRASVPANALDGVTGGHRCGIELTNADVGGTVLMTKWGTSQSQDDVGGLTNARVNNRSFVQFTIAPVQVVYVRVIDWFAQSENLGSDQGRAVSQMGVDEIYSLLEIEAYCEPTPCPCQAT